MTVEILDKTTGKVEEEELREYIKGSPRGVKGQLNELLELCEGEVLQNSKTSVRMKGIKHTWEWDTFVECQVTTSQSTIRNPKSKQ